MGEAPNARLRRKGKHEEDCVPTVHQVLPCEKGSMSLPMLQVGKPRPESGPVCPRVEQECKKASRGLQAWAGWTQDGMCAGQRDPPSGQCSALWLRLWARHRAQSSPQRLQASLLTRASKKTLYILRLTLNKCFFHLSPPPFSTHTLQGPAQSSSEIVHRLPPPASSRPLAALPRS